MHAVAPHAGARLRHFQWAEVEKVRERIPSTSSPVQLDLLEDLRLDAVPDRRQRVVVEFDPVVFRRRQVKHRALCGVRTDENEGQAAQG